MTTFLRQSTIAACCAGLALLYGCGKDEKTVNTPQGELRITQKDGTATMELAGKGVKATVTSGEGAVALPADFPKDMPLIQGGVVRMAVEAGPNFSVHLVAPASVAEAGKFYEDGLKGQGWKIEAVMNLGESVMVAASKGARKCQVTIAPEAKGSLLQLVVPREKG